MVYHIEDQLFLSVKICVAGKKFSYVYPLYTQINQNPQVDNNDEFMYVAYEGGWLYYIADAILFEP